MAKATNDTLAPKLEPARRDRHEFRNQERMEMRMPSNRRVSTATCLLLVAALSACSGAHAQDVLEQIEITLEPNVNRPSPPTPKASKLDSRLEQLRLESAIDAPLGEDTAATAVVTGEFVLVDAVAVEDAVSLETALREIGLQGAARFGKVVSGRLPVSALNAAASLSGLRLMRAASPVRRVGSVTSQGDLAARASIARTNFSVDGSGVTVGVLSDSYDLLGGASSDIASGDLPTDVIVLDDSAVGSVIDEGRAMMQLIHDVAPGADLVFHTASGGSAAFAQGIVDLANAGANVIVDDIGYLGEPFFQDGIIAQAVEQVVAQGVSYHTSAGNDGRNSYESAFRSSGITAFGLSDLHDFDPGSATDVVQEFLIGSGSTAIFSFQWDEPFASAGGAGSASDLDAVVLDANGNVVGVANAGNIGGDAVEVFAFTNNSPNDETFGLVIGVFGGPPPSVVKHLYSGVAAINNETGSATVFGHPNAAGALSIGAAFYGATPEFGQSPPLIEPFSSAGGIDIRFDTDGNPITPQDRQKPDVVAPDGTDTTFFGSPDVEPNGFPNFFGTSAASPHSAAVAALMLEANSQLLPADIVAGLENSAIDMGPVGFDSDTGHGLIDADASVMSVGQPVEPTVEADLVLSCLAGNGRVDLNLVNTETVSSVYRLELTGLSAREVTIPFEDWGRIRITGRPPGTYSAVVARDGEVILSETFQIDCTAASPPIGTPEVTLIDACRDGNGYLLFQMVNPSASSRPYVIEFEGVANRSTTAAAFGQAVRGTTGRPDGLYDFLVRTGSTEIRSGVVEVDCD